MARALLTLLPMPSRMFVERWRDDIRAFLQDATTNVLALRVHDKAVSIATRLLASFEREPQHPVLLVGLSAPFESAAQFYASAATTIDRDLASCAKDFEASGIDPGTIERFTASRRAPEVAFADYLERLQRALSAVAHHLLLAIRPSDVADPLRFRASVALLSAATASPFVKFVIVDRADEPWIVAARHQRQRLAVGVWGVDPGPALRQWIACERRRVLVVLRSSDSQDVAELAATPPSPSRAFIHVRASLTHRHGFYDAAERAIVERLAEVAPERHVARDPRPTSRLEARLAHLAERAAKALVPEGTLVVLFEPHGSPHPVDIANSVAALAAAASSHRVRYLFIVDAFDEATSCSALPRDVETVCRAMVVSSEDVARGLEDQLAHDATSPAERIRLLSMLAGFATAKKEYPRAYDLASRAVAESRDLGGTESSVAWMALGSAFMRERHLAEARDAFARASAAGMQAQNGLLAVQALMQVGHVHFLEDEHSEASDCYRASADYQRRLGNVVGEAQALTWLGESHRRNGTREEAAGAFREALERLEGVDDLMDDVARPGRIEAMLRLARVCDESDRLLEARELRRQAEELGSDGSIHDLT